MRHIVFVRQRGRIKSREGTFFPEDQPKNLRPIEWRGALNIFVAGTVNGCIDLQNANFMKYLVRFEGKGKSPGGRAVIGITPFLTHIWKQLAKQSS